MQNKVTVGALSYKQHHISPGLRNLVDTAESSHQYIVFILILVAENSLKILFLCLLALFKMQSYHLAVTLYISLLNTRNVRKIAIRNGRIRIIVKYQKHLATYNN